MLWLLLVLGSLLILAAALDALWTTLWVDGGAGPISRRILHLVQRSMSLVFGRDRHNWLSLAGPISMVAMAGTWVFLTWIGWTLVFSAEATAVVGSNDGTPAGITDRIYFAAFTLFTLGNGDFVPNGGIWQVLVGFAALNGLGVVTLGLTYIITILSAVVERRAVASQLLALASRAEDLVLSAWSRRSFEDIDQTLSAVTTTISLTAERHLAYPVLHAYHSARADKSLSVAIGVFDEALTILRYGVHESARPEAMALNSARATVGGYLETLRSQRLARNSEVPPPPSLDKLRAAGVPVVDDAVFRKAVDRLAERRSLLLGNMRAEHWEWDAAAERAAKERVE